MTETEIELTRAYLRLAGHDPIAALIRSVRDLTRTHVAFAACPDLEPTIVFPDEPADQPLAEAA